MAIFGPKPWVNFSTFSTSCFYGLERRFFVLKYRKKHFPGLYWLKKMLEKWPCFYQNYGLTLLKNVNFSTSWTSCFYSLESWFFVVKYRKRHFSGLYCLKKKVGKMVIYGRKPWGNPFGKMSIFRLFRKSCLFVYSLERHFFRLEYPKRYFPGLYCLKRKV